MWQFLFNFIRLMEPRPAKTLLKAKNYSRDEWWNISLIKIATRRFLSVWTCAVKHLVWCVHSLLRLKAARPPLIIWQVSKKKRGGFELHRMAEHLGPSSSVWNPRADKQIKCGTVGEDRRESFKQISAHVETPKRFHVPDHQNEHTDFC